MIDGGKRGSGRRIGINWILAVMYLGLTLTAFGGNQ